MIYTTFGTVLSDEFYKRLRTMLAIYNNILVYLVILPRKKVEEKIYQLAHHDLITQLPNRVSFLNILNESILSAAHSTHRLAVMFIDLDHFKLINDTSGHPAGDELLQQVAMRLKEVIGIKNIISRFGGDEFTVLLPSIESTEEASEVATQIIESLLTPFFIELWNYDKCEYWYRYLSGQCYERIEFA